MESYWCTKKNSIVTRFNKSEDFDPALTHCLKSECDMWDSGECFYIRKAGNQLIRVLLKVTKSQGD